MNFIRSHRDIGLRILAGMGRAPTMKVGLEISEETRKQVFGYIPLFFGILGTSLALASKFTLRSVERKLDDQIDLLRARASKLNERINEVESEIVA